MSRYTSKLQNIQEANIKNENRFLNGKRLLVEGVNLKAFKALFGDAAESLVQKLSTNFTDDAVKSFEVTLGKALSNPSNLKQIGGQPYFKSLRGSEIPFKQIENALKSVADGTYTAEQIADNLPRQLVDGTELRKAFLDNFTKKTVQGIEKSEMYGDVHSIGSRYTFDLLSVNYKNLLNDLINKTNKLNKFKFNPKDLKIVASENISGREVLEIQLPTGDRILWYRSSGANVGTTGKETGEWFAIPGFSEKNVANIPKGWFIKDDVNIKLSKGGNQYITDMANWFKTNWGK